jgi:hypothetical protein
MELDHLCRQRDCIHPDHLEPVSHRENCQRGSNARIDMATAERIRADQRSLAAIARSVGLSKSAVYNIRSGKSWQ